MRLARDFDPAFKAGIKKKKQGSSCSRRAWSCSPEYQARLAAQDTWGVLVVLQALDAAGKDGTIRHVMSGVNPQGVAVHSFKVPSAEELDHDFLWRYAQRLPARGRDRDLQPLALRGGPRRARSPREPRPREDPHRIEAEGDVWKRRYREINDWERYLTDNGFRMVKLFLNLSKEEQRTRFLRRLDLPDHNWKFSPADVAGARALRRLPRCVLRGAVAHEHGVGALVRHPRRSQVVRAASPLRACSCTRSCRSTRAVRR